MSEVILLVDKVWTKVKTEDNKVHDILDNKLSVLVPGRWYSKKYRMGLWDGKHRYYDLLRQRFLTGFLGDVVEALKDKGYKVVELGKEEAFPEPVQFQLSDTDIAQMGLDVQRFKSVQYPLVKEALENGRGVIKLSVGGGKTEIMAVLAKVLTDKNVLVVVHRVELLEQTKQRLAKRLGEEIGEISSNKIDIKRVTVGMVMSIWSKRHKLAKYLGEQVDVLLIDECHHASAETWIAVSKLCQAKWRFGFSGTPITENEVRDLYLIGLTGKLLKGLGIKDLVELGYAALPAVRWIVVDLPFKLSGNYSKVYGEVYSSELLWEVVEQVIKFHGQPRLLVFTDRVRVCKGLAQFLARRGYRVEASYGGKEDRVEVLDQLRAGKLDVLVATTVLDEGVDVPEVSGVVMLCSNKSIVRVLQRIGRGVRVTGDKDKVYVYDFAVKGKWLVKHAEYRQKLYLKEGFEMAGFYKYQNNQLVEV